jgi:hypothetical protein
MTERANKIYRAWEDKWVESYKFGNQEELSLAAAIRVIADELSYTIFMPNNDVRVVDARVLYNLANELEDL